MKPITSSPTQAHRRPPPMFLWLLHEAKTISRFSSETSNLFTDETGCRESDALFWSRSRHEDRWAGIPLAVLMMPPVRGSRGRRIRGVRNHWQQSQDFEQACLLEGGSPTRHLNTTENILTSCICGSRSPKLPRNFVLGAGAPPHLQPWSSCLCLSLCCTWSPWLCSSLPFWRRWDRQATASLTETEWTLCTTALPILVGMCSHLYRLRTKGLEWDWFLS